MSTASASAEQRMLFGHPTGLFTLFFAEMWERFSYYGMRALLIFYMTKGFLRFGDSQAYAVYGAYTALVYMTPYFGGMLADKLLGGRRAVVFGGLLMAAGHLLMTIETPFAFYTALALLICGNGFFKPNISTIVGTLYPAGQAAKKDAGFTLFYMGINLGAAMSPILCGYVGETYGWHYGFGLATLGMLIGIAVFVAPTRVTQFLIAGGALTAAVAMPFLQDSFVQLVVRVALAIALVIAAIVAFLALGRGGLPAEAGAPNDPAAASRRYLGMRADVLVLIGTGLAVALFSVVVQNKQIAGVILTITGVIALGYILFEAIVRSTLVERHRLFVVLVLMFFSLLFWAFFEQAGSSISNFTDRNVARSLGDKTVAAADVGQTYKLRISAKTDDPALSALPVLGQAQLGYENADPGAEAQVEKAIRADAEKAIETKETEEEKAKEREKLEKLVVRVKEEKRFTLSSLTALRAGASKEGATSDDKVVSWKVSQSNVGMMLAVGEIPASEFQAANPMFILLLGLVFSALWSFLGSKGREPSTTVKFALGLIQLGLGFVALWFAAKSADARGMTTIAWLLLGYLLHTTGELCISPVGLSMVTKLSPQRMVSTVMGAWFLATSFSNYLAGMIASLTGVSGEEGDELFVPAPLDSVNIYGSVFGQIAIIALISGLICLVLAPLLRKWMHDEEAGGEPKARSGH